MKKNYFRLIPSIRLITSDEISEILSGVQKNTVKYTNNKTHCEDTLTTPMLGGNGQDGVMFDLVVGSSNITIETFWISMGTAVDSVLIYYRPGTFVGNNTSSAGWTYLGGNMTTGAGLNVPTKIDVSLAFAATSSTTYAFYVTTQGGGVDYTNGTTVGNTWATNADLSVLEGNGGTYPFSVTFSPRNFNGRVQYCLPTGVKDVLSTSNVSIFPNPAKDELNISLPLNGESTNVSIYNVIGEVVFTENMIANGTTSKFDISNLKSGVYVVKLTAAGSEYSTKLFVD